MDEKSTPWILIIGGLALVLVFFMVNKQQQPVVVQQKSSSGGWEGALASLVGLGTTVVNKMDF
jgi:hypothetical protein